MQLKGHQALQGTFRILQINTKVAIDGSADMMPHRKDFIEIPFPFLDMLIPGGLPQQCTTRVAFEAPQPKRKDA